jgi:hypothetical protein
VKPGSRRDKHLLAITALIFTLRNVPELRFDFVHPEGGESTFPYPSLELTTHFGLVADKKMGTRYRSTCLNR